MNQPEELSQIKWTNRFASNFTADPELDNHVRYVPGHLYSAVQPTPVSEPKIVIFSKELCETLGIAHLDTNKDLNARILSGNLLTDTMKPYAARYGGHQFGHWADQLGDGRAITLGDGLFGAQRELWEFQLKGAGPTPYSRRGDGRAVLRSSVREFLCSEAMFALGIPTTRALSLVETGDGVMRDMFYDGNPKVEPGAIVCRVAPSFLRFGNWQILASNNETNLCMDLTRYTIENFFPHIDYQSNAAVVEFFKSVCDKTAYLMADWMRIGFVHGVMNTDNMSVLGLTIDYGPYGWLEPLDPYWTPNTTDSKGRRYRFGAQPQIAMWNLARFGEALLCLGESVINEEHIHEGLRLFASKYEEYSQKNTAAKIGLTHLNDSNRKQLIEDLLRHMQLSEMDFTNFFRALCTWNPDDSDDDKLKYVGSLFEVASYKDFSADEATLWLKWFADYSLILNQSENSNRSARSLAMQKVNPKYVLRNYLAKQASDLGEQGDYSLLNRLHTMLKQPYTEQPEFDDLAVKRPSWAANTPGAATLSCSS